MSKKPTLSILVPNRQATPFIFETIENLTKCKDSRLEIIINDNSLPIKLDFSNFKDKRLKIFKESKVLSMSENFYNSLKRATGEYIVFIGSDDGCIPENLPLLIDYLEKSNAGAVTTRHSFFNNDKLNYFVTIPKKSLKLKSHTYRYPNILSLLFYSYRTWLPLPYALAVVKRSLLGQIIAENNQIPGIAPDDFLSHYIAQKIKKGEFFDLPVFITGSSSSSNGKALFLGNNTDISNQFIKDSQPKLGALTKLFGINCKPSLAIEHYLLARNISKFKSITLLKTWVIFSCLDQTHHNGVLFKKTLKIRKIIMLYLEFFLKFFYKFFNFFPSIPARTIKIKIKSRNYNISLAANFIYTNSRVTVKTR